MKHQMKIKYDPSQSIPVIKCSICTGEQTAGFKDIKTGKFTDVLVIHNEKDIEVFKCLYNISADKIKKIY